MYPVVRSVTLFLIFGLATFGCARPDQGKIAPHAPHIAEAPLPPAEPPQAFSTMTPPTYLVPGDQPLVVVFFATWCDLCSYQLDTVRRVTSEVGGTDLLLVLLMTSRRNITSRGFFGSIV